MDPAGDSGAAPDITGVGVSHDAGAFTLSVTTNQPTLSPDASFWGYLDTDRNPSTGLPAHGLGADLFFLGDADGGALFSVSGNFISIDFNSSFAAAYANGVFTARMDRSELDGAETFSFVIESELDDANGDTVAADVAPNGAPFFEYSFAPLALTVGRAAPTPRVAVAGKPFTVTASVVHSDGVPFSTGSVSCKAKAGTRAVRGAGSVAAGSARCSLRVPKGTSGKMLRGSLTVVADDSLPVTRAFAFRIR